MRTKLTAEKRIKNYLLLGGSLTTVTCKNRFGTTELRSVLSKLERSFNMKFNRDKWVKRNGKRYKLYGLKKIK